MSIFSMWELAMGINDLNMLAALATPDNIAQELKKLDEEKGRLENALLDNYFKRMTLEAAMFAHKISASTKTLLITEKEDRT